MKGVFVVLAAVLVTCHARIHQMKNGRPRGGMLLDPVIPKDAALPATQWFEQRLDHFDGQNMATWKQRYFVNDTFYKPGGPVFLQIGGEGTANPVWVVVGQMMVMAAQHNAMAILLEHRYYGDSHPTEDLSMSNLRYLSSEQALADLANFRNVYGQDKKLDDARWITFGGSYPGSLAAWARLKYPHYFYAAVASSAPVWAELNFTQYLEVVQNSIEADGGTGCLTAIRDGMSSVNSMLSTTTGRTQLQDTFHTCAPIKDDPIDIATFSQSVAGLFMGVVQYNRDNVAFEGRDEFTITDVCSIMTNTSMELPVTRLAAVNTFLSGKGGGCFDASYNDSVDALKSTNYSAAEGGRQWFYQVCTEFGYLQSSEANTSAQPFGNLFPVSTQLQLCIDVFGINGTQLGQQVVQTNEMYGSTHIKGSRIVFPNGDIDPWHALSVLPGDADVGPHVVPILIHGTAHCANMYPSREDDMPSLVAARTAIANWVELFVTEPSS